MSESFQFLGFSLLVVLAYYSSGSAAWRRAVLLIANIAFLGTFFQGASAYLPLAAFLLFSYFGLRLIQRWPQRAYLPVLILTLAAFVWLKRYAFVPHQMFLQFAYVTVGLSYILFRVLHLMIDTHSDAIPGRVGFVSFFNYTASFTTLVSGPIQQYQDYVKTEDPAGRPPMTSAALLEGLERIIRGLFKSNVLALLLSTFQTRMLDTLTNGQSGANRVVPGALALVLYPLFIYCNFSGYIDIVIGVGQLLGVRLPENFLRPFSASNIMDFWGARWHITLSAWLKTYVYNPLLFSLMRRFPAQQLEPVWAVLAFFVTFFLIGVWHGQTTEFLFYGFLLGLGVSVNKLYQIVLVRKMGRKRYGVLSKNWLYIVLCRGLTFTWVTFTTIWFWSNWQQIGALNKAIGSSMPAVWLLIFAGSTVTLAAWEELYQRTVSSPWVDVPVLTQCLRTAWSTAVVVMTVAVAILMNQPAPGVVYKAF